jgi:hypothetical protein
MWLNAEQQYDITRCVIAAPDVDVISGPSDRSNVALGHFNLRTLDREVVQRVGFNLTDSDAVLVIKERFDCSACCTCHVEPALKSDDHHWVSQWQNGFGVERKNFLDCWREVVCHLARCSMT